MHGSGGRPELEALSESVRLAGGEDYMFGRIADGDSVLKIMKDFGLSRAMWYRWLDLEPETRRARYAEAQKLSADAYAETAGDILDVLSNKDGVTSPEVQLASARAGHRKWLASVRNKDVYGDAKNLLTVNLNVADLHLDALRQHGVMPVLEGVPVVDAQLLPAGADEDSGP
jgi:hypothetical protein